MVYIIGFCIKLALYFHFTIQKMGGVFRTLGHRTKERYIEEILRQLDGDGDGTVDFPEFLNIIAIQICEDDSNDDLRQAFDIFYKDGDGFIRYPVFPPSSRLNITPLCQVCPSWSR